MNCQVLFSVKIQKKKIKMSFAVVISTLRVNIINNTAVVITMLFANNNDPKLQSEQNSVIL